MKSAILGSAVSVLLLFSVISYSRVFIQSQDQKKTPQTRQVETSNPERESPASTSSANGASDVVDRSLGESAAGPAPVRITAEKAPEASSKPVQPPQSFAATAYNLRGRTSSGRAAARGIIAADVSVLPLGTRVWLDAGSFSGEYIVGDTGGAVRGRRIDIWTPSASEARRFGRRMVKLTVLSLGVRRGKSTATRSRRTTSPLNQSEK